MYKTSIYFTQIFAHRRQKAGNTAWTWYFVLQQKWIPLSNTPEWWRTIFDTCLGAVILQRAYCRAKWREFMVLSMLPFKYQWSKKVTWQAVKLWMTRAMSRSSWQQIFGSRQAQFAMTAYILRQLHRPDNRNVCHSTKDRSPFMLIEPCISVFVQHVCLHNRSTDQYNDYYEYIVKRDKYIGTTEVLTTTFPSARTLV